MATATSTVPVTARRLLDNRVRDYDGDSIGEVEDFVLDPQRGCVDYAIISFGGFMGLGREYHVIPYQMLQLHPDGRSFATNITRDQLERAPGFDRGNVPAMDEQYLTSVYSYWGLQRGSNAMQSSSTEQADASMPSMRGEEGEQQSRSQNDSGPWRERYRGIFWSGNDEERPRGR